jgi:cell division protein FtsW
LAAQFNNKQRLLFIVKKNSMIKKNKTLNKTMLSAITALLVFGLVTLYSASIVESIKTFGNTYHYILHQFLYGVILGLLGLIIFSKLDYHIWQKYLPALIFISLFLLTLVKVPHVGFTSGGASRWINLGFFNFQPAELAKLVVIFYLASWAEKKKHALNDFYFGILPTFVIVGLFSLLILWQPDMGTMAVLATVAMVMLFAAGIKIKYYFWTIVCAGLSLYAIIHFEPYRLKRLTTFFNPSFDPKGIGYQISQALLAIGSGGIFGYGYGLSRQKHNYLPEVMGDSIFAVLAEELGFLGVAVLIFLFCFFVYKGFEIAKKAPDDFGRLTAFGIISWIAIQAIINIAAMAHLIPLTGIPLPFFSYGSSSLLMIMCGCGILLNISKNST